MLKSKMPFLTKIAKASSKSDSLRTTIPKEAAKYFSLKIHDVLIWEIKGDSLIIKKWSGKNV